MYLAIVLIFLSLLNNICQLHGATVPLAGSEIFICRTFNGSRRSPSTTGYWVLNQTNFEVRLSFPQYCIYLYVLTGIEIEVGDGESNVSISDYLITYRRNDNLYSVPLSELNMQSKISTTRVKAKINPIYAEEISISRFINSSGSFDVSYTITGFSTHRVTVLSYLIAQPNLDRGVISMDDAYTGMCNGEVCYGGRGQLMDGVIGGPSDNSASVLNVGWRCSTDNMNCDFPLRMLLTGRVNVSHLVFYGFNTAIEVVPPIIRLIQPDIPTNPTVNAISANTYSIDIPINRVTDEIFLYMSILDTRVLSLSEVGVFSNGVNIARLEVQYRESIVLISPVNDTPMQTSTNTNSIASRTNFNSLSFQSSTMVSSSISPTDAIPTLRTSTPPIVPTPTPNINMTPAPLTNNQISEVSFIIFPLIIIALILLLLVVSAFCIYLFLQNRNVKNQLKLVTSPTGDLLTSLANDLSRTNNEGECRYSQRIIDKDTLYATIGPEDTKRNQSEPNYDEITHGSYIASQEFENPVYAGDKINAATESLESNSQTQSSPLGHLNRNFQTEEMNGMQSNGEISQSPEKTQGHVNQNQIADYEMKENPLYKEAEFRTSEYAELDPQTVAGDFSDYNALRH